MKHITDLNRYKARSFNYQKSHQLPDNVTMIKVKCSLLLGCKNTAQVKFSSVLEDARLQLSGRTFNEDCSLFEKEHLEIKLDAEYLDRHFSMIESAGVHYDQMESDKICEQILYLGKGEICEEFFRYGINLNQYRIGKLKGHKFYTLAFKSSKSGRYLYLRKCKEEETGIALANKLQQYLIELNQQCEGMHVVEHILLRPENAECEHPDVPQDFYPFRISVILPNWSARFNSSRFKNYLEETFHINLPAHVYPEFYWLNNPELKIFEDLYHKWLDLKKQDDKEAINSYSRQIIQFIRDSKAV